MLPYQAVPMDYTGALGRQGAAAAAALTHSWFVPAEFCVPFKHNPGILEPGILEMRKEKSRDAARSRRGKENYEFYELAKMLPLPAAITSQLDKASIIRLTISYLKLRDFSGHGDPPWPRDKPAFSKTVNSGVTSRTANIAHEIFEHHQGTHILQSLDGFAFALGVDGRFLYISETVSIYLGLSQVEMTGSSIFDYVHHQDHSEVAEQLGLGLNTGGSGGGSLGSPAGSEEGSSASPATKIEDYRDYENLRMMTLNTTTYKGLERTFCVRMKSTLTKRGCHFKSSGYRVVLLLCRLRPQYQFSHQRKSSPPLLGLVALAIALPPPSVHEIRLECDMFVTRLNFDFTIAHCEPRVSELLDYTADEITGMNMYTLCHGEDAHRLRKSHIDLINKGQVLSHYYRLMNKNGGYTWVQTCATVVCNSKNAEEQNIICVNYVVSGREYKNLIMDCCQLEEVVAARAVKREETSGNDPENGSPGSDTGEGRSSGGGGERHLSGGGGGGGPELEEEGAEGGGGPSSDQRGRGIMDHATQLHEHSQMNAVLGRRGVKKTGTGAGERRGVKRKAPPVVAGGGGGGVPEDESSCCSSDEEERQSGGGGGGGGGGLRKRGYPVLSPASSSCHSSALASSPKGPAEESGEPPGSGATTSVKDLEQAMSKHLPSMDGKPAAAHQPTDFSADTLLKAQQQRSTIQWIGTHHHLSQLSGQQQGLPASTLLRQLYAANRESVIRANVTAAAAGGGGGGGRHGSGYYSELSHGGAGGPLPTPPGSDGSYPDQFGLHSQNGLYSAAAAAAATGSGYSLDYHSAMTPPSSVSPRDKHNHSQLHSGFESPVYSEVLRHQYLGGGGSEAPAQPLPLKPQPYPMHPTALDYATAAAPLDQQFYHHSSPAAAAAAGFHLYHPANKTASSSPGVYTDPLKNSTTNWYSTPT